MNGHTSNAALCVFHVFHHKVALSKVLDPDVEMTGESGADVKNIFNFLVKSITNEIRTIS